MVGAYKLCSALRGILWSSHGPYTATWQTQIHMLMLHKYKRANMIQIQMCVFDTNTTFCGILWTIKPKNHSGPWCLSKYNTNTNVYEILKIWLAKGSSPRIKMAGTFGKLSVMRPDQWQQLSFLYTPSMCCSAVSVIWRVVGVERGLQYAHTYICWGGRGTPGRTLGGTYGGLGCQWDTVSNRWKIVHLQSVS